MQAKGYHPKSLEGARRKEGYVDVSEPQCRKVSLGRSSLLQKASVAKGVISVKNADLAYYTKP